MANGKNWYAWMFSLVLQAFSTPSNQKYALRADLCGQHAMFSLFFPFFAPIEPHLGHYGSGKWAKLINLDVLSAVCRTASPLVPSARLLAGWHSLQDCKLAGTICSTASWLVQDAGLLTGWYRMQDFQPDGIVCRTASRLAGQPFT